MRQPRGVALAQREIAEGGGERAGVGELRGAAGARELHRAGVIDDELDLDVGLVLELLDVVAVGLGVGAPVDVADVVARRVELVLAELDRAAAAQRAMDAGERAVGGLPRRELQRLDLGEQRCVDSLDRQPAGAASGRRSIVWVRHGELRRRRARDRRGRPR